MPSPKSSSPARWIITLLADLIAVAVVVALAHLVTLYFGSWSASEWGRGLLALSKFAIIPFGIASVRTPYGGVFLFDAAATVALLLCGEWALGLARRSA